MSKVDDFGNIELRHIISFEQIDLLEVVHHEE